MATTFTCDRCGREFPMDQMKEFFREAEGSEEKMQLDPACLDEVMNETGDSVVGVEGDDKQRAAYAGDPSETDRATFGERE